MMHRTIRRIYVTKPKSTKYISHIESGANEHIYQSKCAAANANQFHSPAVSPRNSSSSNERNQFTTDDNRIFRSTSDSQRTQTIDSSNQSELWSNWKRWLIPLLTALGILGAIALAALGLGIYAAIMLSNQLSTTVSPSSNSQNQNGAGGQTNGTSYNWTMNGTTVAGARNISGTSANLLNRPFGIVIDSSDTLYITDTGNNRTQKRASNGWISTTTVAGQSAGTSGGTATTLTLPRGIIMDSAGNIYIADTANHRIQSWPNGASTGTTIIGTSGLSGATNTLLNNPVGLARNPRTSTIYVADSGNHRIMAYTAGSSTGTVVLGGNGAGISNTQLSNPQGLYFDTATNSLLIANTDAHNIVRWTPGTNNTWTLVAGSLTGQSGITDTLLDSPAGVTADLFGNVYVADTENHRIQLFPLGQSTGTTIAGTATISGSTASLLNRPVSVAFDSSLSLYVVDQQNHRVQRFDRI